MGNEKVKKKTDQMQQTFGHTFLFSIALGNRMSDGTFQSCYTKRLSNWITSHQKPKAISRMKKIKSSLTAPEMKKLKIQLCKLCQAPSEKKRPKMLEAIVRKKLALLVGRGVDCKNISFK